MSNSEAGKGDKRRPRKVSRKEFEENYKQWLKTVREKKNNNNKKEEE